MENLLDIQLYAFEPVYSDDEQVPDSEDSGPEGNSVQRIGNTNSVQRI